MKLSVNIPEGSYEVKDEETKWSCTMDRGCVREALFEYCEKYGIFDTKPLAVHMESTETDDGLYVRGTLTPEGKEYFGRREDGMGPINDPVNHPAHYTSGGIECIDAIEAAISSYGDSSHAALVWQVIKYLWRAPLKDHYEQDIHKAKWYLDRLVDKIDAD